MANAMLRWCRGDGRRRRRHARRVERAEAWSKDYCAVYVPTDGHYCHHGNYNSLTYNSGRRQAGVGVCVYAITEAGSVRGGGRTICSGSVAGSRASASRTTCPCHKDGRIRNTTA